MISIAEVVERETPLYYNISGSLIKINSEFNSISVKVMDDPSTGKPKVANIITLDTSKLIVSPEFIFDKEATTEEEFNSELNKAIKLLENG